MDIGRRQTRQSGALEKKEITPVLNTPRVNITAMRTYVEVASVQPDRTRKYKILTAMTRTRARVNQFQSDFVLRDFMTMLRSGLRFKFRDGGMYFLDRASTDSSAVSC